jgi:hypothetical protein
MKKKDPGIKIDFKSLSRTPTNELGVVYLFGVLYDVFDFKIERIQAGFPDCIARREIEDKKYEKLRIEFEFRSKSFRAHKHDETKIDIIVCWQHNWDNCPEEIEIVELSSHLAKFIDISKAIKDPKKLTEYQIFCQKKRLEGYSFEQIAELWTEEKESRHGDPKKKGLTPWQKFCGQMRREGKTFAEIGEIWRKQRNNRASK